MTVHCETAADGAALVALDRPGRGNAWQTDLASSLSTDNRAQAALQAGPDVAEGVAAFVEHRTPEFEHPTEEDR